MQRLDVFYEKLGDELTLYVRQVAWLNTAPQAGRKVSDRSGDQTRLDRARAAGERPLLPGNPAPYLSEWLFDIGPSILGGMGEAPLEYRDLVAWQEITGVELMPWEAGLIRRLSREFVAERAAAKERDRPAPYGGTAEDIARDKVAQQIKAAFAGRVAAKRG